jgi:glutamine synthetase
MVLYSLVRTGLEGQQPQEDAETKRSRTRFLPDNIYDAVRLFKGSQFIAQVLGENVQGKYAELKLASAERCPKQLGSRVKDSEIQFHHEVTNQYLWNLF